MTKDRARLLLDVLMILSLVSGAVWALAVLDRPDASLARGVAYVVIVITMGACWPVLRRGAGRNNSLDRPLAIAFAGLGAAGLFVGDGPGTWPLFLMVLLVLVPRFGVRAATGLIGFVLLVQVVVLAVGRQDAWSIALQVIGNAYVFAFGLALAWLTAEYDRQRQRNADLLAEVRRGFRVEAELVLADERTRAARDLHDGLGHRLTLITMALDYADRVRDRDADRAWAQVGRARVEAAEALATMRTWVRALSPVRLENGSLGEALEAIAESFRGTGLSVVVQVAEPDVELDRAAGLFCHRLLQEALTNTLRHSDASRVEVEQRVVAGRLIMTVADDGRADQPGEQHDGFGLRALRERAVELGGTLAVIKDPTGWRLRAALPLSSAADRR